MHSASPRERLSSRPALAAVLLVAVINHLLTFLAYDWYNGIDGYRYDVCGLQLVSGITFDIFPIMFCPPLIPIVKNILYLLFEGHPYALGVFIHVLGIATTALAYYLGSRFDKVTGFGLGMLTALSLPLSIYFHHISSVTLFVPLLLLAGICFLRWMERPGPRSLFWLTAVTALCFLCRNEALILVPVFCTFGWLSHRNTRQAAGFLLFSIITYSLACSWYYVHFGYFGINRVSGWELFSRVTRARDSQFSASGGPASRELYRYVQDWVPAYASVDELAAAGVLTFPEADTGTQARFGVFGLSPNIVLFERQMFTLNFAQQDIGYLEADRLFLKSAIESIRSDRGKFFRFTCLRFLGQLGLYEDSRLSHKEFRQSAESGHNFGFNEGTIRYSDEMLEYWLTRLRTVRSPFDWERRAIRARLRKAFGLEARPPQLPDSFQMQPNARLRSGSLFRLKCGDGNMEERFWTCRDLDAYFYLAYWGHRPYSRRALETLRLWDAVFTPKGRVRIVVNYCMWALWLAGIMLAGQRWKRIALSAFLGLLVCHACIPAVFLDNFGGRLELHMIIFFWLGAVCGLREVLLWFIRVHSENG